MVLFCTAGNAAEKSELNCEDNGQIGSFLYRMGCAVLELSVRTRERHVIHTLEINRGKWEGTAREKEKALLGRGTS